MNVWDMFSIIYIFLTVGTFIPTVFALLKKVKLNPGGYGFEKSKFSEEGKEILVSHYTRIQGTLIFWKNKASLFQRFHYYTLVWSIPVSIIIPIVIQYNSTNNTKIFLTIMSVHIAIIQAFHKGLKIENNFKAFRLGESEFYDIYRRMLDRPESFGIGEKEQIENYFIAVEEIRKNVRNAEADNFPALKESISDKCQKPI